MSESTPLTGPQRRALVTLIELADAPRVPGGSPITWVAPRALAKALWPDSPAWQRRTRFGATSSQGALGGTMPMKAGRLLRTLEGLGLVEQHEEWRTASLWTPTFRGRAQVIDTTSNERTEDS